LPSCSREDPGTPRRGITWKGSSREDPITPRRGITRRGTSRKDPKTPGRLFVTANCFFSNP